jgi:uncharacterized membrane protein YbhN (UPF0104 family)
VKPDVSLAPSPLPSGEAPPLRPNRKRLVRSLWLALLAALLLWALKNAPLSEIWSALKELQAWQVLGLLAFNSVILMLTATRWWVILRAENGKVPLFRLFGYRLAPSA